MTTTHDTGPEAAPRGVSDDVELIADLIDVVERWAPVGPDEARVYDLNIRWGAVLSGRWERLRLLYLDDRLTTGQLRDYRILEARLREVAPVARKAGIHMPSGLTR